MRRCPARCRAFAWELHRSALGSLLGLAVGAVCATGTAAVGSSPASAQTIPTPESIIGFPPGADFRLADYEESIAYFRALEQATDRIRLIEVGRTSEGRPWILAVISSPENLARLEEFRLNAQRIAHPEGVSETELARLIAETPAFVDISGGLHASEVAGAQHTIALAYHLLSNAGRSATAVTATSVRNSSAPSSASAIAALLERVVLFLWPSLNPDGQDIVVRWYRENVGTPYETAPLHELYQKYVGHDNNRDAYMLNTVENRVVARTWRHWEPQLIHVHHQSSPFPTRIWLPPFAEPIANRVAPRLSREVNTVGMVIAQRLETEGKPGATHMGTGFDAWYPGYIDYLPMLQNVAAFWTETALYRYATPHFYSLEDFPAGMRDFRTEALYASPWKGGWWRLSDAVDYMLTASMADLDYAVKYHDQLLYNRWKAGMEAIERYRNEPPFAWIVPREQRDPMAAVALLRRLAFNGIRISQLTSAQEVDGVAYPGGTWVVPMDQEFAELARNVLEVQHYPDLREFPGGPPEQPYDAAGWTLPLQMGVRVVEAGTPLSPESRAALRPVKASPVATLDDPAAPLTTDSVAAGIVPAPGRITGSGGRIALDPAQNHTFALIADVLAHGGPVGFARGRYVVSDVASFTLQRYAREYGLSAMRTREAGVPVRLRAALYRPWTASMDEGWTRWLFDRYALNVDTVTNAALQAGELRARHDVIVLPSESPNRLLNGWPKGVTPPRYEGGIGAQGVRELDTFVRDGGTLVCLSASADFCIEQLHLPVKNVVDTLPRQEFFASGSILEVKTDSAHPVMAGMPARAYVFFDDSPVFTTTEGFEGVALAKYADDGSPLASGYLLGEKWLHGHAAALDVRHGAGHVLLIGFRPQWRGQSFGTFRVLLNSLFFAGDLAARAAGTPEFWSPPKGAPGTQK
jgi:hypothetical protein